MVLFHLIIYSIYSLLFTKPFDLLVNELYFSETRFHMS